MRIALRSAQFWLGLPRPRTSSISDVSWAQSYASVFPREPCQRWLAMYRSRTAYAIVNSIEIGMSADSMEVRSRSRRLERPPVTLAGLPVIAQQIAHLVINPCVQPAKAGSP